MRINNELINYTNLKKKEEYCVQYNWYSNIKFMYFRLIKFLLNSKLTILKVEIKLN